TRAWAHASPGLLSRVSRLVSPLSRDLGLMRIRTPRATMHAHPEPIIFHEEIPMDSLQANATTERYAKCIEVSKRIRWDIDRDVIRGRKFDFTKNFLPKGLSKIEQLPFLSEKEGRMLS